MHCSIALRGSAARFKARRVSAPAWHVAIWSHGCRSRPYHEADASAHFRDGGDEATGVGGSVGQVLMRIGTGCRDASVPAMVSTGMIYSARRLDPAGAVEIQATISSTVRKLIPGRGSLAQGDTKDAGIGSLPIGVRRRCVNVEERGEAMASSRSMGSAESLRLRTGMARLRSNRIVKNSSTTAALSAPRETWRQGPRALRQSGPTLRLAKASAGRACHLDSGPPGLETMP